MNLLKLIFFVALFVITNSCNKPVKESNDTYEITKLKSSYLNIMQSVHQEARVNVDDMHSKIQSFYSFLTETHYVYSRESWVKSNKYIIYLGPFRYMNSSLLSPYKSIEKLLDLRIIKPEYIDSIYDNPNSGIIVNPGLYPILDQSTLYSLNQIGSEDNISVGFHAIEFLLWGEDNNVLGPGNRPRSEFTSFYAYGTRRMNYLMFAANQVKQQLLDTQMSDAFKSQFFNLSNEEALQFMLSGVYRFTKDQFAEQFVKKPYDSQNQRDEWSPFSDNTIIDLKSHLDGLKNVLYGNTYFNETDGYFLMDYILQKSSDSYSKIENIVLSLEENISKIQSQYFDNAITSVQDRVYLLAIYNDLIELSDELELFANSIGIQSL